MNEDKDLLEQDLDIEEEQGSALANKFKIFLNNSFYYFVLIVLAVIFYFSYDLILKPKYDSVIANSNAMIEEKEDLFRREFRDLRAFEANVKAYKSLNQDDINRVFQMIPAQYSREDLMSDLAYFLMSNNFTLSKIDTYIPDNPATNPDNVIVGSVSRRGDAPDTLETTETTNPRAMQAVNSISPGSNVGLYYIEVDFVDISYNEIKFLLSLMERSLRLMDVTYLEYDPAFSTLKMEAKTYFYKE